MTPGFAPPIDRLDFLDGQTFAAQDLNDAALGLSRYRALHNRYLHRTWGIAFGLGAAVSSSFEEAVVQPGYAIGAGGEDVLLLTPTKVAAPNLPNPQTLLLAASPGGALEWWTPHATDIGAQVPLMAAYIDGGKISGTPDFNVRRYAHSLAQPRLGSGVTSAGHTGWTDSSGPVPWIEATVDTSGAGFVKSPQYFASLSPPDAAVLMVSAGPQSFTVRVVGGDTAAEAESEQWTVTWVGIESGGVS